MEPLWTIQQGIAYECARDIITDCVGILSAEIYEEADPIKRQVLRDQRFEFVTERSSFHVSDVDKIASILVKYRAFFVEHMDEY